MIKMLSAALFSLCLIFASGCTVEQTEEGEMPEVDVEGGNMPEYDVDPAEVEVEGEERTIEVPDVDVDTEEQEIVVPDVDINDPDDPND